MPVPSARGVLAGWAEGRRSGVVRHMQRSMRMTLREFEDGGGDCWRVWQTDPARTEGLTDHYRGGWLTFDNGAERRRLAPVPDAWAQLPPERLVLLLRAAHVAISREAGLTRTEDDRGVAEPQEAERREAERREAERRLRDRRASPAPDTGQNESSG